MVFCPDCGSENSGNAKFCRVCGKNLSVDTMSSQPQAVTPTAILSQPSKEMKASLKRSGKKKIVAIISVIVIIIIAVSVIFLASRPADSDGDGIPNSQDSAPYDRNAWQEGTGTIEVTIDYIHNHVNYAPYEAWCELKFGSHSVNNDVDFSDSNHLYFEYPYAWDYGSSSLSTLEVKCYYHYNTDGTADGWAVCSDSANVQVYDGGTFSAYLEV